MEEPEVVEEAPAAEVSESLVGLMGAFDKLKEAVGYGGENNEFNEIERFVQDIEQENAKLRQHAEDAIVMAQKLQDDNTLLLEELTEVKMNVMVTQTQELTAVAYEYDKEVVQAKVADAEAVLEEVVELRERVQELEEENAALVETLNETRQSQQQLQRLQAMDAGQSTPQPPQQQSPISLTLNIHEADVGEETGENVMRTPISALTPLSIAPVVTSAPSVPGVQPSPGGNAEVFGSPQATTRTPATVGKDPTAVAEALSAVAGGAEGGVAVVAARMLREYASTQQALEEERAAKEGLAKEVEELTETMTAKTFKAPSAWAEREVKYKQEKKAWEETRKESDALVAKLQAEVERLRGATGAVDLDRRIEELEAKLLESERDRDAARAALHELQLASRPSAGEFSNSGVKPYSGPRLTEEGEVQQVVEMIESSGGTPRQHTGERSVQSKGEVMGHMATLQRENTRLRVQLEKVNGGPSALETPQAVREALSSSAMKRSADLQHQLAQTQLEKAAVLAELENLREAVGQQPAPPQRVTLQLNVREAEARTEVALLQRGVDCDTAHALAVLEGKLQEAQEREALALQKLEDASAALAAAPSGAPEPALETELGGEQPDEGGDPGPSGREAIEEVVESIQAEKQEIEAQMRDVAAAAASVAPLALAHPVAEDSFVEELPPAVAEALSEVAAAARAGAPAEGEEEEQGESVGALAPAAEDRLQELIARLRAAGTSGAAAAPVSQPSETAAAAPVVLNLNVNAPNEEPAPAPVVLNLAIKDAEARAEQTVPAAYEPVAPVVLNVAVASDADGRELSLKEQRIRELEHMLQDMALEEDRLRSDLELLQPVRLNFTLAGNDPGAAPGTGMSRRSSNGSLNSADNVAQDRAEAEAAWQEHVKKSDVPALLRTKAELETKCHMLESQLEKAQAALAAADREKGLFQESIDDAIKKGDVGILTGLRDGLRTSTARMMSGSKGFGVFKRKGGVSRKEIKTALHDTQGALVETETERNTLRRQLARMSKKYGPGKAGEPALSEAAATAAVAGAVSIDPASGAEGLGEEVGSVSDSEGSQHLSHLLHDAEAELAAIRDENSMLMEHLVTTKVRLAEVEGDYLESRRALLRSREKQMQLARQVLEVQMVGAGGTPQEPAEEEKTPSAGRTDGSERRRSLKLPGF